MAPHDLGVRLVIDPGDPYQLEMWLGAYQPHVVSFLRRAVKPGSRVLCAGLHVGYVASLARKLAGPTGVVLTAEPDEAARDRAAINLALATQDAFAPIHVLPGGLSDETTELQLYRSAVLGHSSFAAPHEGKSIETVPLRRGDDWLRQLGVRELDVLVLDVEGWELHVLRGLEEVIANSPGLSALIEVSEWALRDAGSTRAALFDHLAQRGFDMRWAAQVSPVAPLGVWGASIADAREAEGDLLCVRHEIH
ncbi:MAG TPA: FkbM family methyltransferase [Gemmatimonadaceae bacterium]|nr:FkbM family methyltransferase [Gemmatimonadaceae bacterium]